MERFTRFAAPLGRFLLGAIFLASAYWKIVYWSGTVEVMAEREVPAASLFLAGAVFIELVAALALVVGFQTRLAAGALFLYLIPVTLLFHNFLGLEGPERHAQEINLLKNLAIMGGLAMLVAHGAGALSVDSRGE
jgi:putative oxidoreductase